MKPSPRCRRATASCTQSISRARGNRFRGPRGWLLRSTGSRRRSRTPSPRVAHEHATSSAPTRVLRRRSPRSRPLRCSTGCSGWDSACRGGSRVCRTSRRPPAGPCPVSSSLGASPKKFPRSTRHVRTAPSEQAIRTRCSSGASGLLTARGTGSGSSPRLRGQPRCWSCSPHSRRASIRIGPPPDELSSVDGSSSCSAAPAAKPATPSATSASVKPPAA